MSLESSRLEETRGRTESYIVIHTWYSLPCLICDSEILSYICELHPTIPNLEYLPQCSDTLLDPRNKWTKIHSTITNPLACFDKFWYWRVGELQICEIFIILHEDIVLRSEMLDEIGLEYECLYLSLARDELDISDLCDHLLLGCGELSCRFFRFFALPTYITPPLSSFIW
jgi:hypothetical protein